MTDAEQIRELYRKYWDAMIAGNTEELGGMMSDGYALIHMTGARQTKETFLRELAKGTFRYYTVEHDGVEVRVRGDRAEMTGRSRVAAAVYGGQKRSWRLQGDFTLKKENGIWKLTGSRASTY